MNAFKGDTNHDTRDLLTGHIRILFWFALGVILSSFMNTPENPIL